MDQYLVLKTHVNANDDISTQAKLFYKQIDARVEYLSMVDQLQAQIAFLYSMPLAEFDIEEFGDIIKERDSYSFKDFEGVHNIKLEIKTIQNK